MHSSSFSFVHRSLIRFALLLWSISRILHRCCDNCGANAFLPIAENKVHHQRQQQKSIADCYRKPLCPKKGNAASRIRNDSITRILHASTTTATATATDTNNNSTKAKDPKAMLLGRTFVEHLTDSLEENTFVSLALRGVKKTNKTKKKKANEDDTNDTNSSKEELERLRGSIREVRGRLISIPKKKKKRKKNAAGGGRKQQTPSNDREDEILMQLTVKYHGATDICKNFRLDNLPEAISNLVLGDNPTELASEWGVDAVRAHSIQSAQLATTNEIWDLQHLQSKPALRSKKLQSSNDLPTASDNSQQPKQKSMVQSHDRIKRVPVSGKAEFLQKLGVTDPQGHAKPRMKGKLRQCQKFVEIVGRIVDDCVEKKSTKHEKNETDNRNHQQQQPISVVDMGCGRAYLTFSLHAYLQERYGSRIKTKGIDVRPKLVAEISGIARSLGSGFDSLLFEEGTIEQILAKAKNKAAAASNPGEETAEDTANADALDVLVALHACDTATDDALYSGIAGDADVIVVAPCCHKEVRPQLDLHYSETRDSHPYASILQHGVYRERLSETVTDSLRGLLLELAGYKVRVFEFIGGEHTSKNVMITATKTKTKAGRDTQLRHEILSLASLHGIRHQKLARWMNVELGNVDPSSNDDDHHQQQQTITKSKKKLSSKLRRMPPLVRSH